MHNVEQAQPTFCEMGLEIGRTFHVIELAGGLMRLGLERKPARQDIAAPGL